MAQIKIAARKRSETGKGAARRLRREKQIPAVFYGPGADSMKLAVRDGDLQGILKQSSWENVILGLEIESDSGKETKTVMIKELQVDPIKDTYLHADFYEISMDKEITVDIPIRLVNTPVGVTNGGILQAIRRQLPVTCLPNQLIEAFELDVSGLEIGDSLHVSDITLPEGLKCQEEDNLTVALVAAPTVAPEAEEEEEEGVEEEVAEEGAAEAGAESSEES